MFHNDGFYPSKLKQKKDLLNVMLLKSDWLKPEAALSDSLDV
jgi:hypothetical protein